MRKYILYKHRNAGRYIGVISFLQAQLRVALRPELDSGDHYNHLNDKSEALKPSGCNDKFPYTEESFTLSRSLLARRVGTVTMATAVLLSGISCKIFITIPQDSDTNYMYANYNNTWNDTDA